MLYVLGVWQWSSSMFHVLQCMPHEQRPKKIRSGDYDRRTAIHIAAAEGNEQATVSVKGHDVKILYRLVNKHLDNIMEKYHW